MRAPAPLRRPAPRAAAPCACAIASDIVTLWPPQTALRARPARGPCLGRGARPFSPHRCLLAPPFCDDPARAGAGSARAPAGGRACMFRPPSFHLPCCLSPLPHHCSPHLLPPPCLKGAPSASPLPLGPAVPLPPLRPGPGHPGPGRSSGRDRSMWRPLPPFLCVRPPCQGRAGPRPWLSPCHPLAAPLPPASMHGLGGPAGTCTALSQRFCPLAPLCGT
jgi:hypothetical protein